MWTRWLYAGVFLGVLAHGRSGGAQNTVWPMDSVGLRVPGPLSQRIASYRMNVHLDEKTHEVSGSSKLLWRNTERKEATELVFNLYQNAFKNHASTFIHEVGAQLRGDEMPEHGFGAVDVSSIQIGGVELLAKAQVVDSLLKLKLDSPIPPGTSVEIALVFKTKLPKVFARSGYAGSFHAVGQWFPKIAVFECDKEGTQCGFRAHQYHGLTEFFSDHGCYEVTVDVPENFVVGATGVKIEENKANGRKKLTFRADDVRDFAWFADPDFVETTTRISDSLGEVELRLLNRPGLESTVRRHVAAVGAALIEGERRYYPYPYKQITVVVPPHDGGGAGGMEYPQIITSFLSPFPDGVRVIEGVDAHEFGHQWVPLTINSDETEDAWMDEGLNQTFTAFATERLFQDGCSTLQWLGFCMSDRDADFLAARSVLRRMPLSTVSWKHSPRTYPAMTYGYTSLVMRSLENYLGNEKMRQAMQHYAQKYRFGKPRPTDFMAAISDGALEDLSWFWKQAIQSTRVADYEVMQIENNEHELAYGLWDCPPKPVVLPEHATGHDREQWQQHIAESNEAACKGKPAGRQELEPPSESKKKADGTRQKPTWDSAVVVRRRGEFIYPVEVLVRFHDGSQVTSLWSLDEQNARPDERIKTLYFFRRAAVEKAEVDPGLKLALDEKRLNNGLWVKPHNRPVNRLHLTVAGYFQTFLELLSL